MKVLLLLPPVQSFFVPYSAPAVLARWLESRLGCETMTIDVGVNWLWYELSQSENTHPDLVNTFIKLQNGDAYSSVWNLRKCFHEAAHAMETLCEPFAPESVELSGIYHSGTNYEGWGRLIEDSRSPDEALFDGYIDNVLTHRIEQWSPDLIGFSIPFDWMIRPSLRLSWKLRKKFPKLPQVMGGNVIERLWNTDSDSLVRSSCSDWLCIGDGERSFDALFHFLRNGEPTDLVDTLIALPNSTVNDQPSGKPLDTRIINSIPLEKIAVKPNLKPRSLELGLAPNYRDYNLNQYLRPKPIIPVPSSQGCFYGKCNFCSRQRKDQKVTYYESDALSVFNAMKTIHDQTNADQFILADDIVSHRFMKRLSEHIVQSGLPFEWFTEASFKESMVRISSEDASLLFNGGCRIILNGLESASDRIREAMGIRLDLSEYASTLKKLSVAGVVPYTTIIFGYPGEEQIDLKESLSFIDQHKDIAVFATARFYALEGTPLIEELRSDQLSTLTRDSIVDGGYRFEHPDTVDQHQCDQLISDELPGMFGPFQHFLRSIPVLMQLGYTQRNL